MSNKYFGGLVENKDVHDDAGVDADLAAHREALVGLVTEKMGKLRVADGRTASFNLFKRSNKYIDETEPWKLAKDPEAADRLATVLYNLMDSILTGTTLLQSYMPETAEKIFAQIGASAVAFDDLAKSGNYPSGTKVTDKPEILFARMKMEDIAPRIAEIEASQKARIAALTGIKEEEQAEEKKEEKKEEAKEEAPAEEAAPIEHKELCTYDDFAKCEFRVGEILECEEVKKSRKLLCSKVKIGPDEVVQICSGLRPQYTPETMVGKKVMVIVNLAPRKMAGLESQGMILCAEGADGKLALMTPEDAGIDAGAEIC
jgi:methionyl-tRNA synthetase